MLTHWGGSTHQHAGMVKPYHPGRHGEHNSGRGHQW